MWEITFSRFEVRCHGDLTPTLQRHYLFQKTKIYIASAVYINSKLLKFVLHGAYMCVQSGNLTWLRVKLLSFLCVCDEATKFSLTENQTKDKSNFDDAARTAPEL